MVEIFMNIGSEGRHSVYQ